MDSSANNDFKQIFSPGLYFRIGLGKTPLVIGAGRTFNIPGLRTVRDGDSQNEGEEIDVNVQRSIIFLAVDIPMFPLY